MRIIAAVVVSMLATASAQAVTPIHAYAFDGNVNDSIGGANGTLIGGASVVNGRLLLDGNDDYVQFNANLVPTTGAYSVFIRVDANQTLGGFTEIISQGFTGGTGFFIGTQAGGGLRLTDTILNPGVLLPADETELLFTSSASGSNLYLDGTLVFATATVGAGGPGGTATRFGRQFGTFSEYFGGSIDEIRIYDQVITPADLVAAVPEPASWAMLIAGFGLTGAAARRRRLKMPVVAA